jgi:hypothetical protein
VACLQEQFVSTLGLIVAVLSSHINLGSPILEISIPSGGFRILDTPTALVGFPLAPDWLIVELNADTGKFYIGIKYRQRSYVEEPRGYSSLTVQ